MIEDNKDIDDEAENSSNEEDIFVEQFFFVVVPFI